MVLFGPHERMRCARPNNPFERDEGEELRLRNSLWPDFWDSWPRETHRDLSIAPELLTFQTAHGGIVPSNDAR